MDTNGAGLLGNTTDRLLHVPGGHHHEVSKFVHHHQDVAELGVFDRRQPDPPGRIISVRIIEIALGHRRVVATNVAETQPGEHLIAPFHLVDRPRQRVRRLLGVRDDRRQKVGKSVVLGKLDHLGVDQNHAHLIGGGPHEDRREQ